MTGIINLSLCVREHVGHIYKNTASSNSKHNVTETTGVSCYIKHICLCILFIGDMACSNVQPNCKQKKTKTCNSGLTFAKLAVNKTHSNNSPILWRNSSTWGRFNTYTWEET